MRRFLLFSALGTFGVAWVHADSTNNSPNLLPGDFESGNETFNPWAGVDDQGGLQVIPGSQIAVDDNGDIKSQAFSPSIAVGDLNGDGLPDLVVGDARGYFWFFPNSGKLKAPAFTHAEVIPIWLGSGESEGDAVPRIQLVDIAAEGKLSIVAGNYFGGLYYVHNLGSASAPAFRMTTNRADLQVATHTDNLLWCNYLSPFLYDWSGTGRLDLVMGDGSYSANSIFLFTNQGSNDRPIFTEKNQEKIIPGMGREHLTPQVVDWNGDGKPDIIAGERVGYIDVWLNQAAVKTAKPVFDKDNPIHVMFGSNEEVNPFPTVCVADLNNDGLFDLLVGSPDGHLSYSLNIGTPTAPKFGPLVPLHGLNPYPKVIAPSSWSVDRYRPDGAAYELLECTNANIEKGFTPPPDPFKGKGALKFSIVQANNVYFKTFYAPDDNTRYIRYSSNVYLAAEKHYRLTMWARKDGDISNLTWKIGGYQGIDNHKSWQGYTGSTLAASGIWSQVETDISIPKIVEDNPNHKEEGGSFIFWLTFEGNGTLYLDDIRLQNVE